MGNKTLHKIIAVFVAAAMIMTCSIGVFAATSPETGKVKAVGSDGTRSGKTLTINWTVDKAADKYIVKVGNKTYTTTATKLKVSTTPGASYKITVTPVYGDKKGTAKSGTARWMRSTKITKAVSGKKKVTLYWKKAKGATKYRIMIYKNGKWTTYKTVGARTSYPVKVAKKGTYKFKVVPIKGSAVGVHSAVKSGKAK